MGEGTTTIQTTRKSTALHVAAVTDINVLRHPVTNAYMPAKLVGKVFLRKAGNMTGKIWDEEALRQWEQEENDGRLWEGRGLAGPGRRGPEEVRQRPGSSGSDVIEDPLNII